MDTPSKSLEAVRQHLIGRGFSAEFKGCIQNPTGKGIVKLTKPRLRVGKSVTSVSTCVFAMVFVSQGSLRVLQDTPTAYEDWDVNLSLNDPELFDKLDGVIDMIWRLAECTIASRRAKYAYFRKHRQ